MGLRSCLPLPRRPHRLSTPLVNLSAGKAPLAGAGPYRPPFPGPPKQLGLANLSSSWLFLQSRALALRGRMARRTLVGVLPSTGRRGQEGGQLAPLLSRRKAPYHPALGSSLLHQELQSRGGMWGAVEGVRV